MNDIRWRDLNDEELDILDQYPDNEIIVKTDVCIRLSTARYINPNNFYMEVFRERAIKFAFLEDPA
jgi:hypothetical protein